MSLYFKRNGLPALGIAVASSRASFDFDKIRKMTAREIQRKARPHALRQVQGSAF